jgi:hypothetical protein
MTKFGLPFFGFTLAMLVDSRRHAPVKHIAHLAIVAGGVDVALVTIYKD